MITTEAREIKNRVCVTALSW